MERWARIMASAGKRGAALPPLDLPLCYSSRHQPASQSLRSFHSWAAISTHSLHLHCLLKLHSVPQYPAVDGGAWFCPCLASLSRYQEPRQRLTISGPSVPSSSSSVSGASRVTRGHIPDHSHISHGFPSCFGLFQR